MCIIIYKKEGANLPSYEVLKRCFYLNSDGAGICYIKNNSIKLEKGFFNFETFYKRLLNINTKNHLLIHMRISTGGFCNENNCHPFKIKNNLYFAHNGVLKEDFVGKNNILSDTFIFNEMLKFYKLNIKFFDNKLFVDLLKEKIGDKNKLVFFGLKKYYIINEELGFWENGVWFSNTCFKKYSNYKTLKINDIF